jgi:8-oxo-dGTP pyrophosphatase MutT (NUDIX family)
MPISEYLRQLRQKIGHDLLLLPSAAVAIHDDQMRLLLCLHADRSMWVAPGGLIEPGEQPADAAVRETWEETGLLVEITGILGVYGGQDLVIEYANGDQAAYVGTVFRGRVIGGELRPDGHEILDAAYYSRAEFDVTPHSKWMDGAVSALFSKAAAPHFQPATWRPQ